MAQPDDIHGNLTKWDCEQPDPHEGLVCTTCGGSGKVLGVLEWFPSFGPVPRYKTDWCPDCGGRGKP